MNFGISVVPPLDSPIAASIPFANLFASWTSSVENNVFAEPGIRAFSDRYVFLASEGRKRSAIMPAVQHTALKSMWCDARNTPRRTMRRGFGFASSLADDAMAATWFRSGDRETNLGAAQILSTLAARGRIPSKTATELDLRLRVSFHK